MTGHEPKSTYTVRITTVGTLTVPSRWDWDEVHAAANDIAVGTVPTGVGWEKKSREVKLMDVRHHSLLRMKFPLSKAMYDFLLRNGRLSDNDPIDMHEWISQMLEDGLILRSEVEGGL